MIGCRNGLADHPPARDLRSAALDIVKARILLGRMSFGAAMAFLRETGWEWAAAAHELALIMEEIAR